eukprot:snap_masked-scaffold_17-processed-gene-4.31-mRNA-1 protein AED:1.00 eAED:1.00 QI:0/0/0/0/1/1/2/0/79
MEVKYGKIEVEKKSKKDKVGEKVSAQAIVLFCYSKQKKQFWQFSVQDNVGNLLTAQEKKIYKLNQKTNPSKNTLFILKV